MKTYNAIDMKGRLYDYSLEKTENDKGNDVIRGNVMLEVDENGTVVTVNFYQSPTYNSGKPNRTYNILESIMEKEYGTVLENGEEAEWLAFTGSVNVNYFESRNSDEIARSQKLRGGFINKNEDKIYSNKWKLDMLITRIKDVEENEEKRLARFVSVGGYFIDDWNKRLMEVQFKAKKEAAMDYILSIDASEKEPYFVSISGAIEKYKRVVLEENAFGEPEETKYSVTDWVITRMSLKPYQFGDERDISEDSYDEFKQALEGFKEEIVSDNKIDDGKVVIREGFKNDDLPF